MRKLSSGVCLLLLAVCWGCGPKDKSSPDAATKTQIEGTWQAVQSSYVRVQREPLGEIPNSGMQLPVVSRDGKWIAYLDFRSDQPITRQALFSGQGLENMSLEVQEVAAGSAAQTIYPGGAGWPTWSADSRKLLFVAYNENGRCDLGIHDVSSGATRRLSMGQKEIMMPAVDASGKKAAVVILKSEAESAGLYVVNLENGLIEQSCPSNSPDSRQFWPQWTADGRIVFVLSHEERSWLVQWLPGKSPPERLCEIRTSASQIGAYQALAGVGRPLSPDDRYFAYYDATDDRIVLVNLRDGTETKLSGGVRAGCWLDRQRFAGADDKEMRLFGVSTKMPTLLMRGVWLPRNGNNNELILCARGRHQGLFALVRMKILAEK